MNNKGIIFAIGALIGAAGGAITTYYIVHENAENRADEEIDRYSEYCEERIEKYRLESKGEKMLEEIEAEAKEDPDEEKISHNEGVKKYHHSNGLESAYGAKLVFNKDQKEEKKTEDSKLISEINEDDFLNDDGKYDKQTIDVCLGDDADIVGFWGYETDNEEFVDKKFGKTVEQLTGMNFEQLLNCVDDDDEEGKGVGVLYLRNDEIMTDFEFIIHDYREDDLKS